MKTFKFRVKDKHRKQLSRLASEVNLVWNYCNELSFEHTSRTGKFFSGYDLQKYTNGATKEGLNLLSHSVQEICVEYARRRKQFKKSKLRWRVSSGTRRSLGWIPFKKGDISFENGVVSYAGKRFVICDTRRLESYELRAGSFSQDACGHWYVNICINVEEPETEGTGSVGIDLGLKDFAVLSTGEKIEAKHFYRDLEPKLSKAQRAKKHQRVRALHAKIANRRKDYLHKTSTRLVNENKLIVVGDVNSQALAKTRMAKSVLDAGWSMFRSMLEYKAIGRQVWFDVVNEAYTTQTCSECGSTSGPRGVAGLGIREWFCVDCGASHDRDVNAARNILAVGHGRLAEEISLTSGCQYI